MVALSVFNNRDGPGAVVHEWRLFRFMLGALPSFYCVLKGYVKASGLPKIRLVLLLRECHLLKIRMQNTESLLCMNNVEICLLTA